MTGYIVAGVVGLILGYIIGSGRQVNVAPPSFNRGGQQRQSPPPPQQQPPGGGGPPLF